MLARFLDHAESLRHSRYTHHTVLPSGTAQPSASRYCNISWRNGWLACFPYRRFVTTLADRNARLGAGADRYSFTTVDFHYVTSCWFSGARQYIAKTDTTIWSGPMAVNHLYQNYINDPNKAVEPFARDADAANFIANVTGSPNANPVRPFAAVTFITPCITESDHPVLMGNYSDGPLWLAWLVDNIASSQYWDSTVIVVTWDDWGGFYDHFNNGGSWPDHPPKEIDPYYLAYNNATDPNSWGVRVPLMVISPYLKSPAFITNYTQSQGAILTFIEGAMGSFGLTEGELNGDDFTNFKQGHDFSDLFQPDAGKHALPFTPVPYAPFQPPNPGAKCPHDGG